MKRTPLDFWIGLVVAASIGAALFMSLITGSQGSASARESYRLQARFENIGALKKRAPIKSAGVQVGQVVDIEFDPRNYVAVVTMQIDKHNLFPRDTFATINTSGMLGEQFIGLDVGADTETLKDGDLISKTQSAIALESLIGQFMTDKASK